MTRRFVHRPLWTMPMLLGIRLGTLMTATQPGDPVSLMMTAFSDTSRTFRIR